MKQEEEPITGLPENAFRELKPGEVYNPLMSPDKKYSEVNAWSVTWGILMAILFSAAAAYLGLKVGCQFWRHRGRCHLHPSGALYPSGNLSERNHCYLCTSLYQLSAGRCAGYSLPYPLP